MKILIVTTSKGTEWILYEMENGRTFIGCRREGSYVSARFINRIVPVSGLPIPVIGATMHFKGLPFDYSSTGWLHTSRVTQIIEV